MQSLYNYAVLTMPAAGRLRGRNVLSMIDLSPDELASLLATAMTLKAAGREQQRFEKPSLRTRVSFEIGMTQLGGHAVIAHGQDFLLGKRETPEDVARVLSRYADAIVVRTHEHEPLQRFAAASTVPVINGLSQAAHPCQALADMLTIKERFGQ
jgi:ornithine carbamoyltransferase